MGPPAFAGGNHTGMVLVRSASPSFNGATGFRRWKRPISKLPTVKADTLQWGHRLSPVETGYGFIGLQTKALASMGPPAFAGGNRVVKFTRTMTRTVLQWGHRLSPVETIHRVLAKSRIEGASMGPPAFAGGNNFGTVDTPAPLWLQWGHRLSPVETFRRQIQQSHCLNASMGPPAFAGGNKSAGLADGKDAVSFNGATGFRRWKRRPTPPHHRAKGASMGPPAFAGGNCGLPGPLCPRQAGFNGATGFRRWKRVYEHSVPVGAQCFNGATGFRRWKPFPSGWNQADHNASMGPPAFAGGNHFLAAGIRQTTMLQWGHRLSPVETSQPLYCQTDSLVRFNGATGFRRWKLLLSTACRVDFAQASMGPPAFAGGNAIRGWASERVSAASMGPPAFAGGNWG